ncbi:hypothetical protein BDA96_01G517700 [Sorghum bicolor]|uniref:Uncharacterized protein n=2 Tax=Sorghum bicolor TaxID=4558 RepID=A0A921S6Z6_SORBI|nr:hypothetical protein BDA96_01G517700 [Sorghum bicolor]OQU93138.1 hypothetical protein SORBI_3001G485500 [Sorghum bicolor]
MRAAVCCNMHSNSRYQAGYIASGHHSCWTSLGEVIATTEHEESTTESEMDYSLIEQAISSTATPTVPAGRCPRDWVLSSEPGCSCEPVTKQERS